MLDNINLMDNLNAKWNIEQVNIIFDRFHVVFLNWIPKSWLSFWTILHRRTDFNSSTSSRFYILRASTHEIYMETCNTFLRLVKKVLVPYLKTGHDSIQMLFFYSICI